MSRRRKHKPVYFYCPKCGEKKLRAHYVDDPSIVSKYGSCRKTWICDNDRMKVADEDGVVGAAIERCGCEISVPGRDAEPADYINVLDRLVSSTPQICSWILGNHHKVHRTGLKRLFSGDHLDVVRLRDDYGIGIYVFFRSKTFEADDRLNGVLSQPAAQHIKFKPTSVPTSLSVSVQWMFHGPRLCLFHKTQSHSSWGGPVFADKIESPELLKMAVRWAEELDKEFLRLVNEVKQQSGVYRTQEVELIADVKRLAGDTIRVESYDHVLDRAYIRLPAYVTREQLLVMAHALSASVAPADVDG